MSTKSRYPVIIRQRALDLLKKGNSINETAGRLKLPRSAVEYWRKSAKTLGGVTKKPDGRVADALSMLKHARNALNSSLRSGKIKQASRSDLYMLLALDILEGD